MTTVAKNLFQYAFLILMLVLATLILMAPQIRILSEYMVHIMFLFFFAGLIFFFFNLKKLFVTSFAITGLLCVFLKNESNTDLVSPERNNLPKVKILHYNLANIDDVFDLNQTITRESGDILSFQELTPDWSPILHQMLDDDFPFSVELVRIDPFGKALYSKTPITDVDTLNRSDYDDLKVACTLDEFEFYLYTTYIQPALDQASISRARIQLETLSADIVKCPKPVLAFGEFNNVYWSEQIRDFRSKSLLNNSRKDVVPASFKVPYDHIFFSSLFECVSSGDIQGRDNKKLGYAGVYQFNLDAAKNRFHKNN